MSTKKIFTIILMLLVIFSLGASYIFTGAPQQQAPADDFTGPNSAPRVTGPATPPPTNLQ